MRDRGSKRLQNGGEGMCAIGGLGTWGYHTARRGFPSGVTENGNRIGLWPLKEK